MLIMIKISHMCFKNLGPSCSKAELCLCHWEVGGGGGGVLPLMAYSIREAPGIRLP